MMMTIEQLEKTIRLTHSKNGEYKTIIVTAPHLYRVVTRVNYLTAYIWCQYINGLVCGHPEIPMAKNFNPLSINWMTMNKTYRRGLHNTIKQQILNSKP